MHQYVAGPPVETWRERIRIKPGLPSEDVNPVEPTAGPGVPSAASPPTTSAQTADEETATERTAAAHSTTCPAPGSARFARPPSSGRVAPPAEPPVPVAAAFAAHGVEVLVA